MSVLAWIAVGVVGLAVAFGCFLLALYIDEDLNHWVWPSDNGPGRRRTGIYAVGSMAVAALVLGLVAVALGALT